MIGTHIYMHTLEIVLCGDVDKSEQTNKQAKNKQFENYKQTKRNEIGS